MSDSYCYEYPRPSVTTDCVVFGLNNNGLHILLIQRKNDPYKGKWAFPGGFLDMDEDINDCALRELNEETGIHDIHLEQLKAFGAVNRDPRGRVISVAFYTLIRTSAHDITAGDDAADTKWFSVDQLPPLAFDHEPIFRKACSRLKEKIKDPSSILVEGFTKSEVQKIKGYLNP